MGCDSLILSQFTLSNIHFPLSRLLSSPFRRQKITGKREYLRAINSAVTGLGKRGQKLTFLKDHEFNPANIHFESITLNPSPTAILNILCKQFLQANVSAILYMMNYEQYGRSTASAQYFLQLAGYLGIPVISWNADNSGKRDLNCLVALHQPSNFFSIRT